jgi:glycosyltransferase involved in cell wall biosynthesis
LRPFFPKVVFHWHAIGHGEWAHGSSRLSLPGPEWLDKSARVISRLLLYKPDFSIAVSRNSTNDARAIDSRQLFVIPNGIVDPWPDYDLRIRQTRLERAANLSKNPQEPLRLLFLSRGTVEKGLPDALNAVNDCLSSLTAMTRPIHLTIAGGMDQATQRHVSAFLSVMASTHGQKFDFKLLDFVTGADKLRCYENADVFLELFKPFEELHDIKILRMSKKPFGLFFEANNEIYLITINEDRYSYRKLIKSDYYKSPLSKK